MFDSFELYHDCLGFQLYEIDNETCVKLYRSDYISDAAPRLDIPGPLPAALEVTNSFSRLPALYSTGVYFRLDNVKSTL